MAWKSKGFDSPRVHRERGFYYVFRHLTLLRFSYRAELGPVEVVLLLIEDPEGKVEECEGDEWESSGDSKCFDEE